MSAASDQITQYLSVGGLFNPEMMNQTQHEAVRDTLIKARDEIQSLERENAALRTVLKRWLKVADDCHREQQEVGYSEYNITVGLVCNTRALLDAARKEAQP